MITVSSLRRRLLMMDWSLYCGTAKQQTQEGEDHADLHSSDQVQAIINHVVAEVNSKCPAVIR